MAKSRPFPHNLDEAILRPQTAVCPPACQFNRLCPHRIQKGVARLFEEGHYHRPQDCGWWERLAVLVKSEFGAETTMPATADDLDRLLMTRIERAEWDTE